MDRITCEWPTFKAELLSTWQLLSERELEATGKSRNRIAQTIHRKYGLAPDLIENYLSNFERTLPLM